MMKTVAEAKTKMLIRRPSDIPGSDITPRSLYLGRREFIAGAAAFATVGLSRGVRAGPLPALPRSALSTDETPTKKEDVTHYNNYYEYGLDKSDPAVNAPGHLKTSPWTIKVEGECAKPGVIDIEDLLKPAGMEERIYRHRCVEGWSMVIPWEGRALGPLLSKFEPTAKAKYVAFQTLADPAQMPGLKYSQFDWPYSEGLRLDEAMHPLTILALGVYGETLPNQNGAPVRLVVPWKYGFKSIKSIVSIRFVEAQPKTLWNSFAPHEYGFYSNVNPDVDHPRWSQAKERRIGEFLRRSTLKFNGYGEQVASLYQGMDLVKNF